VAFVTGGTTDSATELPGLGQPDRKATAISSNDVFAVGAAKVNATDWHACRWDLSVSPPGVTDIGTLPGYPNSVANDISESSSVTYVGEGTGLPGSRPLAWDSGFVDELLLPGTDNNGSAQGVNNSGTIVGYTWSGTGAKHAVRWDSFSGPATLLP